MTSRVSLSQDTTAPPLTRRGAVCTAVREPLCVSLDCRRAVSVGDWAAATRVRVSGEQSEERPNSPVPNGESGSGDGYAGLVAVAQQIWPKTSGLGPSPVPGDTATFPVDDPAFRVARLGAGDRFCGGERSIRVTSSCADTGFGVRLYSVG